MVRLPFFWLIGDMPNCRGNKTGNPSTLPLVMLSGTLVGCQQFIKTAVLIIS
ncbi:MAG: hypothetical protein ACI9C4_000503 [Paraglaciecola sp.]|jgi:hypothetical protein